MSLLTAAIYVLIILGANNNGSVTTQEFKSEQACIQAKAQIEAYRSTLSNLRYSAICVPLNIKEQK
jgi:RecB family endonuclease NucS